MVKLFSLAAILFAASLLFVGCNHSDEAKAATTETTVKPVETPEYFLLRPEAEKAYGYSHAVKIGNDIKVSGAVSMDDKGFQQLKEIYYNK